MGKTAPAGQVEPESIRLVWSGDFPDAATDIDEKTATLPGPARRMRW
jgi:hypothetical protein